MNTTQAKDAMNRKATVRAADIGMAARGVIIEVDGDEAWIRTDNGRTVAFDLDEIEAV